MEKKKKVFLIVGILFVLASIAITIDIFRRTSPPGKRKHLPTSIFNDKK